MAVRITVNVLRVSALLALVLGLLTWVDRLPVSILVHMLLGIIVTLALWVLGGIMFTMRGGAGLGIGAIVLGLIVLALGLSQKQILLEPNSLHWIVQVLHLIVGLAAIGIGEAIGGRYRRQNRLAPIQQAR